LTGAAGVTLVAAGRISSGASIVMRHRFIGLNGIDYA
jgi:hypothetical protein